MTRPETRADSIAIWIGLLFSGYAIWCCGKWIATLAGLLK